MKSKNLLPCVTCVWKSGPLTERDLTIPKGNNTHSTGSMLFDKGVMEDIDDPRVYFRDRVFNKLNWHRDTASGKEHMERAEAQFELIILGNKKPRPFTLKLSHNTRTDTKTYEQNNSMTQLVWSPEVRPLIAREALLGCTAYLYRDEGGEKFILEIA